MHICWINHTSRITERKMPVTNKCTEIKTITKVEKLHWAETHELAQWVLAQWSILEPDWADTCIMGVLEQELQWADSYSMGVLEQVEGWWKSLQKKYAVNKKHLFYSKLVKIKSIVVKKAQ